ncbi:WYL domain-containing protein [Xenorhabdus sp. XENO-1]|uniref:WYL domain-containing protein n=1 Tax=Xenorhabdus bovienii TaxID=40576 RepID=UPI0020CA87F4|nr:WYL domain-containing protein [Xenorhabdus bovienii]MCP9269385.1 WYL domain-containing protein [Xenorhabdus bovienii subsp. africana]
MITLLWILLGVVIGGSAMAHEFSKENKKLKEQIQGKDSIIAWYKGEIEKNAAEVVDGLISTKANRKLKEYLITLSAKKLSNLQEAVDEALYDKEHPTIDKSHDTETWDDSQTNEFRDGLSIVWADQALSIEFSYGDLNDNRSRREVRLNEVSINADGEPYFSCFCMTASDNRTFKVKRITSKIQYAGKKYSKAEFFDDILKLSSGEFL